MRRRHGVLEDEQGDGSSRRVALVAALGVLFVLTAISLAWPERVLEFVFVEWARIAAALVGAVGLPQAVRYFRRTGIPRPPEDITP